MASVDLSTRERAGHVVAALRGEQDPCGLTFGMLTEQLGVSITDAFARLRARATNPADFVERVSGWTDSCCRRRSSS
jgi:hypothetical protein